MDNQTAIENDQYKEIYRTVRDLYANRRQLRLIAAIAFGAFIPVGIQRGYVILFPLLIVILGIFWFQDMRYRDAIYKRRGYIEVFFPDQLSGWEREDSKTYCKENRMFLEKIKQNLEPKVAKNSKFLILGTKFVSITSFPLTLIDKAVAIVGYPRITFLRFFNILLLASWLNGFVAPFFILRPFIWFLPYYVFFLFVTGWYLKLVSYICKQENLREKWINYWKTQAKKKREAA